MAVASAIGHQAISLWPAPEAHDIGQVIFLDGLRSPRKALRTQMAYGLRSMSEAWDRETRKTRSLLLATSVLATCDKAIGGEDDAWTRLYCYAFTVCESVDRPPFKPDRWMKPTSPEVAERLEQFGQWYRQNRERLEEMAAKETPKLEAARARMDRGDRAQRTGPTLNGAVVLEIQSR